MGFAVIVSALSLLDSCAKFKHRDRISAGNLFSSS